MKKQIEKKIPFIVEMFTFLHTKEESNDWWKRLQKTFELSDNQINELQRYNAVYRESVTRKTVERK